MSTEPPLPQHEWLAIAPAIRGDYVEVHRLTVCHGVGGVVVGCRAWPMMKWRPWGLTPARVNATVSVGLCEWIGDNSQDLFLRFFDKTFEDAWKKSSEMAAEGPKNRGKSPRPPSSPPSTYRERDQRSEIEIKKTEERESAPPPPLSLLGSGNGPTGTDSPERGEWFPSGHATAQVAAILCAAWNEVGNPGKPDLTGLEKHAANLLKFPDLAARAFRFYKRDGGQKRGDSFWRDSGWSLRVFVSQGLHAKPDTYERWSPRAQALDVPADVAAERKRVG